MTKGIKHKLAIARGNVQHEITGHANQGGKYACLAGEGYMGGYRDALDDVLLALNGVIPNRHFWWETTREKEAG